MYSVKIDNDIEKLDEKRAKLYEDEIINKEAFREREDELTKRVNALEEEKAPLLVTLSDNANEEGVSIKDTPFCFMLRNTGVNVINLNITI